MTVRDIQSRKWQITINNPQEHKISRDDIRASIKELKSVVYYAMCDEVGESGTPHMHIYIAAKAGLRFSTLKKRFPTAHIEKALGSHEENRAYLKKEGEKYADKADTNLPDTFEEDGDMPEEPGQGYRTDIFLLYNLIVDGATNAEIMAEYPDLAIHINRMDMIRQNVLEAEYQEKFRELTVTYIFGPTETGKTRGVLEKYGYSSVYRVTDYEHPFDRYSGQPVLLFDEFRSSLRVQDMLLFLEGYPLNLPARYAQRVACYTKAYIISNIDLRAQYPNVQQNEPASWKAFVRRINKVIEYRYNGSPVDYGSAEEYLYTRKEIPGWVAEAEKAEEIQEELPF